VKAKRTGDLDLVFVDCNCNYASSSPYFANFGSPGDIILAVFAAGYFEFNIIKHVHECYLLSFTHAFDDNKIASLTVCADQPQENCVRILDMSTVSWNFWIEKVESNWFALGLSGGVHDSIINPTPDVVSKRRETKEEMFRKEFYKMLPYLCNDDSEALLFWEFRNSQKKRLASQAALLDDSMKDVQVGSSRKDKKINFSSASLSVQNQETGHIETIKTLTAHDARLKRVKRIPDPASKKRKAKK
jgi:hypothetical protein